MGYWDTVYIYIYIYILCVPNDERRDGYVYVYVYEYSRTTGERCSKLVYYNLEGLVEVRYSLRILSGLWYVYVYFD